MAYAKPLLRRRSNINRPPSFTGECYGIWKIRMQFFLEAQYVEVWDAVKNGHLIPTTIINGASQPKP